MPTYPHQRERWPPEGWLKKTDEGVRILTAKTKFRRASDKPSKAEWVGKAPNSGNGRGQWKDNSDAKSSAKIGFATVSVKLRPAEKVEFQAVCKELGVSPNRALRSLARRSAGFLEVEKQVLLDLKTITRQIGGIATNINQIAKAGNRTLSPDYLAFMEDRKELGVELARLERLVQRVLNVGKRRADGLALLKDAVELDETAS